MDRNTIRINNDCDLVCSSDSRELGYAGNPALEAPARQIAEVLAAVYKKNALGEAGDHWIGVPPIRILINDNGGVEIGHRERPEAKFTTGIGFVLGTLQGIGLAKGKKVELDKYGVSDVMKAMSPACVAVRFKSFADLAEAANALARSYSLDLDPIDVSAVPKATGVGRG